MAAGQWNFTIEIGADFDKTINVYVADVLKPYTGFTGVLQIRDGADDTSPLIIELTTANGRMVITNPGLITLHIDAADTDLLAPSSWGLYYDLVVTGPGPVVNRELFGRVRVLPMVSIP